MAIQPNPDRNQEYMYRMWGTTNLITDYWTGKTQKNELREVVGDNLREKQENNDKNDQQTLSE